MSLRGRVSLLGAVAIMVAACSGSSATPSPTAAPTAAPTPAPTEVASTAPSEAAVSPTPVPSATPIPGGLLDQVLKRGTLVVSTDPNYAPQSIQNPDGSFSGFDIDVATEIAKRLGVKVQFTTPDWSAITAGGWGGRWDISVGSMTITTDRSKVLDFSPPYYYTPAQFATYTGSGITTIDGFANKTVCAGESTTYLDWLQGRKLDFGSLSPTTSPPAGVKAVTQKTDALCAQLWASGRHDFQGWLSAGPTVQSAIDQNQPVVKVGDPVYYEPLAVAVDKSGPNDLDFMAALKSIVDSMHADGTLTQFSMKWYKLDLTQGPG